ncbi:MAG: hypothetical protein J0I04_18975 [Paenarthrobacter ureafaciens]|uniref:hypothetical protein n=1 Tax=Paenarthrobacter ureafaciens TaxID=37931 RepID=UPI001AC22D52|nr:hypothetical protein [Paenarthrobacter ureafaciens]MBN9131721.1 hypothetical protein [Paenarthrobacter ureafaciens]
MISASKHFKTATAAAVAVASLGLATFASPALAAKEGSLAPDALVLALGHEQRATDLPPAAVTASHAVSDLPRDSIRLLKKTGNASYYVAVGPDRSEICLVVSLDAPAGNVATACTTRPRFNESGLSLHILGDQSAANAKGVTAYLLPADVSLEAESAVKSLRADATKGDRASSLVVVEGTSDLPAKVELQRSTSQRAFVLSRLD